MILRLFLSALLLAGLMTACSQATPETPEAAALRVAPIGISAIAFYRDNGKGEPGEEVEEFKSSERIFHVKARLNRPEVGGITVKVVLVAVDTSAGKDVIIEEVVFKGLLTNQATSKLELPRDWPVGRYRVDVYLNDRLVSNEEFHILP